MEKELFATRLHQAATAARDFARRFIEEPLPDELRFRVRLNSSYDGNPRVGDEVVYPQDSGYERANAFKECTEEQVLDLLWRDGRVPEWINLSVIDATGSITLLEALSCGRFTADERLLYHAREGNPPFHILGPALPPEWNEGMRFSIHRRSECWTWSDIEQLRTHAAKVWSLELIGHELAERALSEMPELPNMEILELKLSALEGHGLADLHRHGKLHVLRIHLDRSETFSLPELPKLRSLARLEIENLPSRDWGAVHLLESVPSLSALTVGARDELHVDEKFPPRISELRITAKRIVGRPHLPSRLESLSLHLSATTQAEVSELLGGVKQIKHLHLNGTPVSDAYAETLPAKYGLAYLNLVDTGVSEAAVERITASHPQLRLHPNLKVRKPS